MVTGVSLLDAPRRRLAAAPGRRGEPSRHAWALDLTLLGALVVAVALVFGLIHRRLELQTETAYARLNPAFAVSTHPGREAIMFSSGVFLAVLVGSTGLAALRHRFAAVGIFVLAAMTPLVQAVLGVLPTDRGFGFRVAPTSMGGWAPINARPELGHLWRGFAVDYGLALLPAVAIVAWTLNTDSRHSARWLAPTLARVRRPTASEVTGLAVSVFLFWLFLHTWELRETLRNGGTSSFGTEVVSYLPFFLLGATLARGSRWRFVPLAAVPVLWSSSWIPNLLAGFERQLPSMSDGHEVLPFVAVVATGALWRPIASVVDGERTRAWVLLVALNALNIADVLFTKAALHSGQAVEANPFAAWIGPGAKLVGVGLASALLARFRPRALIWLVLVFGALIAWHLSGLILDTS